ncbi:glucan 1,4-alpha-glucosidase [Geomonas sp. Red32]|uniref:glucan 1,4-alpha-glucosidase n=1 Tax=Geomonas sp. Red32 TaxID=2912856 RepID=UPI00202CBF24|nr:glucan 1,4-alpha-glucosidase [Geomonas sp. Red32]MCM0083152.1 glucan 1,4-alpha-glucosidase [Geomonas sp. Red32]
MDQEERRAPGWPGIPGRWTSSAKSAVGTSQSPLSTVWFTLSHGIFNEIYFPRIDQACVRDMGLLVTGPEGFCSEEKRDADHRTSWVDDGVPAFRVITECRQGRYRIEKVVLTDPARETVLQQTIFTPLQGELSDYRLYVLLAPHLANHGAGNNGWVGDYKGEPMLFAERDGAALALGCSAPWLKRSVGYVGTSDGWQDIMNHGEMQWEYLTAPDGNIALAGEIDLVSCGGKFLLALGFGHRATEAGNRARASLQDGYLPALETYLEQWKNWQRTLLPLDDSQKGAGINYYRVSTAVLRSHEAVNFPGGIIASLAIPWGFDKGDDDLGGYHLVWPRDLAESAGALLAVGAHDVVLRVLRYLQATQEEDGHWAQNMWLDGSPYWNGIQMDETALPVLLVDMARREGALDKEGVDRLWTMVRRAASYLLCNGPVSPQDRWEEDPGYSLFTVATEIAALLAAADLADTQGESEIGRYFRETADVWNDSIDRWMYATDSDWTRKYNVPGYYVRITPADTEEPVSRFLERVMVKNVPDGSGMLPANHLVSPDALALVRFGLREADDPRIAGTIKVIDALLKFDTPKGPLWHRYNDDGYGEREGGEPFEEVGIGRAWPLLTGERAHYELAAGRSDEALRLARAMENYASREGLMPEQVWDANDIPELELFKGSPSGSAMPLVWAHAEYLKLLRSLRDGKVFDLPPQTVQRYLKDKTTSPRLVWRYNHKLRTIPAGQQLRIETPTAVMVRWSGDDWETFSDIDSRDTTVGMHVVDLDSSGVSPGRRIVFTFYWFHANVWEETDYFVEVDAGP